MTAEQLNQTFNVDMSYPRVEARTLRRLLEFAGSQSNLPVVVRFLAPAEVLLAGEWLHDMVSLTRTRNWETDEVFCISLYDQDSDLEFVPHLRFAIHNPWFVPSLV
jgi:hypothetical protein